MRAIEFIPDQLEENKFFNKFLFPVAMAAAGTAGLEAPKLFQKKPGIENPIQANQDPKQVILPSDFKKPEIVQTQPQNKNPKTEPEPEPTAPLTTREIIKKVARDNGLRGDEFAQFIGQCAHESANFSQLEEDLMYSRRALRLKFPKLFPNDELAAAYEYKPSFIGNKIYANKNGNGNEFSGDGYRYRGRGFIHLTGKYNYQKAGDALGIDLVNNPDLASDPELAADIALWYWRIRVKPKVSGKYSDTRAVTKQINPGLQGLQKREANFQYYKSM